MGAKNALRGKRLWVGVAFAGFSLVVQHQNGSHRGAGNESGDSRGRPYSQSGNDGFGPQYDNRYRSDILFDTYHGSQQACECNVSNV
jgi:hypothetical protein